MKKNYEYLCALRKVMKEQGIDACIISGTDPHQSELPPHHWRGREWLTGFESENGTNGTVVVTQDEALCWTDSRYFIQAESQLADTGFKMMKEDGPEAVDLIDWVTEHTNSGQTVGIDGMTFSVSYAQRLQQELNDNGVKLNTDFTPFDIIYPDRPERPKNKLFVHDEKIVGQDVDSKIEAVLKEVKGELANAILISALDDLAWVTNLRAAGDINFSPIYVGFLYLDEKGSRVLFIDEEKLSKEVEQHLDKYHITTAPYDSVKDFVSKLSKDTRLLLDPQKTARGIYDHVGCTPVFGGDGVAKLKSIKNQTMISNLETAMEKDGVALTRFFMMVEKEYPGGKLTEVGLGKALRALRLSDPSCVDESFSPILGWNAHGAIVHYEATEETDVAIVGDGLLLVDSGGQYIYGTTDITRTVALGTPTQEQCHDFTLVMKGHIALSNAVFPAGTTGHQLDVLARQFLWKEGKAYYHGTGHGVGYFINCHEGPQNIRLNINPTPLEPGMITSNEPGLYLEGRYGIRCENLIVTEKYETTEFGEFLHFHPMTLFPFDLRLFETSIMSAEEIKWVNDYHTLVRERLTPLLTADEAAWLAEKTKELK
ncbi:MAG: aminopeptidase P family protein [Bacteroidales bacterium]|nr:aminopeptidase P family protein [Bacteroidales bacterium]MBD5206241.1 aminopeptidase P family protein [Bacteroidales bacterium]MBD5302611.1 aminopeptidase P family protein [Bacteroides sp.]